MSGKPDQKSTDNRSGQLDPQNVKYHLARGASQPEAERLAEEARRANEPKATADRG